MMVNKLVQVSNHWKREESEDANDINDEETLFANIGRERVILECNS